MIPIPIDKIFDDSAKLRNVIAAEQVPAAADLLAAAERMKAYEQDRPESEWQVNDVDIARDFRYRMGRISAFAEMASLPQRGRRFVEDQQKEIDQ